MGNELYSGVVALGIGFVVGIVLFVPFVAISYRRRGRLTVGRFLLWAAALVYFWAIWTYTLLPLPDAENYACAGVNLNIWAFIDDLRGARSLTDFAVLQLALNVLLFMPLGFFLRVLGGRGIVVAFATGLLVSLTIETTQLTGVWGLYPCAYRVFDVDDMLTNTVGAVLGSLVALIVPRRWWVRRSTDAGSRPHPVTRGRRLLAMFCDLLGVVLVGYGSAVAVQVFLEYVVRDHAAVLDGAAGRFALTVTPIAIWAVVVLATGRTPGDLAVELRYRGGRLPAPVARPLRFLAGIGGYLLLDLVPEPWTFVQFLFAAASVVLVFTTRGGRGLPGLVTGQWLVDARESAAVVGEGRTAFTTPEKSSRNG
ncbi:VanZ family protein [Microbacterium sp. B24]|uniref:VanZ family protein n=1 Tax=Microbacterium sp. B24 TaxID=95616 RepID=UPI0004021E09|nr:VanZ family protein [Microbacterium sp. B24]